MNHVIHDIGIASQIAAYSDAIEVKPNLRWLLTSGTPGLTQSGDLPKEISSQAELAWKSCHPHVAASQYDGGRHCQGHPISDSRGRH